MLAAVFGKAHAGERLLRGEAQQFVASVHVVVQARDADAEVVGHPLHGDVVEAATGKQPPGGVDDPRPLPDAHRLRLGSHWTRV